MRILHATLLALFVLDRATAAVTPLASPAPDGSGESSLHTGPDGTTYLTFSAPGRAADERALWVSTLAPGADAWSKPRAIVSTAMLMENWADFATLTVGTDGQLWAQWYQTREGEDAHGYAGWLARSRDGGTTWSEPAALGEEFVSLAPLSAGRVLAVWLESSRSASAHAHPATEGGHEGTMRLKARLLASDGTRLQDWVVDPDVCTCCQTTLTRLGGDRVLLAYRGHAPGEIRDTLYSIFQQTTWSRPRALHADGWKIAACPVNGPAADARGESVAIAWFTGADGQPRVQVKQSRDGGIAFGPALRIDLGKPLGRLDLVKLADDSALVAWLEAAAADNAAGLYVRRVFPDGTLSAPLLVASTGATRASGFPRLATRMDSANLDVVVSWTDAPAGTARRVQTAIVSAAALPPVTSSASSHSIRP